MNNDEYEQRQLFCEEYNMKRRFKISITTFPGAVVGISFPWTDYVDATICILFIGINFKWRKR